MVNMYIALILVLFLLCPSVVYLCYYQLNEINGTIAFPPYENNLQCTWIFNITSISNQVYFRSLLITFRHFDTEFGHDELFIGETIPDVSRYNSKFYRFSGRKLPEPCVILLRGDILTRSIWMEFNSDQTTTGTGFVLDYSFQSNQTLTKSKSILIDAEIRAISDNKTRTSKIVYPYPRGSISSPNYPQNYSNNIICRWHIYQRNAFIRLYIDQFDLESHYDTLTIQLGQNLNNRAMILYEWSGKNPEKKDLFIRNDNLYVIFATDQSNNASGFVLNYEVIEKKTWNFDLDDDYGEIHSENYPDYLRSNSEYIWNIYSNESNEFQVIIHDIDLDFEHDYLQIITDEMIYSLTTPKSLRISIYNHTKLILRTKHAQSNEHYRGFNLTYQKWTRTVESNSELIQSPCGRKYSTRNGTIEFYSEIFTSLDCLIFIEVDDGQNLFLRFDHLQWDKRENFMDIGLTHDYNQHRIFHIADAMPKTWFVANDSQIWIRFSSSQYSLGPSAFRLYYSETIQWSTVSPEPYVQILDDPRLFPYRLISLPTNQIYHNLTQAYIWHIEALDDESIRFTFQSFQSIDHRRICFSIKDFFQTSRVCTDGSFPSIHHHIGSCTLSIEADFIWILVQYEIDIEKFKKITTINEVIFNDEQLYLTLPVNAHPFIQHQWLIHAETNSSKLIFDIANFDGNTPAELILFQNPNTTETFVLNQISAKRFAHVFSTYELPIRVIYKSSSLPTINQARAFRLNLYKISQDYFHHDDFHYISYQKNQTSSEWSIHGQYENSTFSARLYSSNANLSLQTTANVDLNTQNPLIIIPTSDFDIRYSRRNKSEFLLILHEQYSSLNCSSKEMLSNKTFASIETSDSTFYSIEILSTIVDTIDFLLIKADDHTVIRLDHFNSNTNGYLLLNSAVIQSKGLSSLIGLRFAIRSLNIRLHLQSLSKRPIELRYQARSSSNQTEHSHHCSLTDLDLCKKNSTCNSSCFFWFDYKSTSMNYTRMDRLWPYALRGSVTLIIENTTVENFESKIYRTLRQSIARIVRKFCLKSQDCLSRDVNAIRADHVIIQNYDEQIDNHRLYVAIFIKDPYRRTIALTNEQFFLALKRYRQEIYQDIQHYINLPTNISDEHSLDPIWLYGVCLLAVLVLLVVILMLIMILAKRTSRSTDKFPRKKRIEDNGSTSTQPVRGEEDQNQSTFYHESESSDLSNSTLLANPVPKMTCHFSSPMRPSYFHSTIESAMKERLEDDGEPIPFIDENLSSAHSRKSSACWSDRTSLSSRLSLIWKLNRMRTNSQNRSNGSKRNEKRRANHQHRTMRYTIPPTQPNEQL